ncbi:Uma2 family endonuclease [Leptolyngbya sp. FACHB-261]|uniref:Uma2 family endonuclease n=1 Tax=Leptolyngbya sp. FACHB-261 TaxID=2692806 RepID=UPI001687B804|nr:Uma2 family endonuclease [Leptolyngbya sp. FACHB-261]MBD2104476.1 Uma2 family endonuclease [Leptolyngbya sp. FACHB-261]
MSSMQTQLLTDTWIAANWDEYLQTIEAPAYEKAKAYYHDGRMRLEMAPVGSDHACDHTVIMVAISLFAALKAIPLTGRDNCTYRKIGFDDAQPDASYYIGDNADIVPWGTTIIDLDSYPAPALVIEVANTSLEDDKGEKRLLYEDLQVREYWIVDVKNVQILAFTIENNGSRRINQSMVLPGLSIPLLREALQRTRQMNQSQVVAWLLSQFQQ